MQGRPSKLCITGIGRVKMLQSASTKANIQIAPKARQDCTAALPNLSPAAASEVHGIDQRDLPEINISEKRQPTRASHQIWDSQSLTPGAIFSGMTRVVQVEHLSHRHYISRY